MTQPTCRNAWGVFVIRCSFWIFCACVLTVYVKPNERPPSPLSLCYGPFASLVCVSVSLLWRRPMSLWQPRWGSVKARHVMSGWDGQVWRDSFQWGCRDVPRQITPTNIKTTFRGNTDYHAEMHTFFGCLFMYNTCPRPPPKIESYFKNHCIVTNYTVLYNFTRLYNICRLRSLIYLVL